MVFIRDVKKEAHEIINEAEQTQKEKLERIDGKLEDLKKEKSDAMKEHSLSYDNKMRDIKESEDLAKEEFSQIQSKYDKLIFKKKKILKERENSYREEKKHYFQILKKEKGEKERYTKKLHETSGIKKEDLTEEISKELVEDMSLRVSKDSQVSGNAIQIDAERKARSLLQIVLNRFQVPCCNERGIGFLDAKDEKIRDFLSKDDSAVIKIIEKLSGVDIHYNPTSHLYSFTGFDPVRRELGRMTLFSVCKKRESSKEKIQEIFKKEKKKLFKRIDQDGNRVEKSLRLKNIHPQVKKTLGSLRYRYSFTQNQYFHVEEVGFFCGLLCAEMGISIEDGKKAGLFHDIGKAMDHIVEGNHATIGADFIEKYGEEKGVVHAVRAHHFDVSPEKELDYLVIAADALSGARPGARRFTAANYAQKMEKLETIGKEFEGVDDAYVLSGGRELRVIVNGSVVDDRKGLKLSEEIARKIEKECVYPGTIKVNVIRKTQYTEMAQ